MVGNACDQLGRPRKNAVAWNSVKHTCISPLRYLPNIKGGLKTVNYSE